MPLAPSPAEAAERVRKAQTKPLLKTLAVPSEELEALTKTEQTPLRMFGTDKKYMEAASGTNEARNDFEVGVSGVVERLQKGELPKSGEKLAPGVEGAEGEVHESGPKTLVALEAFLKKITETAFWLRIGKIFAGALIVLFGLYLVARALGAPSASKTVGKVAGAVGSVRG